NFVDVANFFETPTIVAKHLTQSIGKIFREEIFNSLTDCLGAAKIQNLLERGIQAGDTSFQIHGQQADIDRLDNGLVKLFEEFQLCCPVTLFLIKQTV